MNLFKTKAKGIPSSPESVKSPTSAPGARPQRTPGSLGATSNAYVEPGGGHIDFGAKVAARVAGETRDLLEAKRAQAETARISSSESHRLVASSAQGSALQQPGALATLNRTTRVHLQDLHKPAWANAFVNFGVDEFLMSGLNKIIDMQLVKAKRDCEEGKKTMTAQQMRDVYDMHVKNALSIAQSAYDERGVTVSLSLYRDPATHKGYVDFTVPTSVEEKDLWQKQLLARYNSSSSVK